jgi:hypothetical protein
MEVAMFLLLIVGFIALVCAAMTGAVIIKFCEILIKIVMKKGKPKV